MKVEKESHPQPYAISWIKKSPSIKATNLYRVSISIGKLYQDSVTCEFVNIDKCHILLGRLWKHDADATHRGKKNIYMFIWKGSFGRVKSCPETCSTYSKVYKRKRV